jgi:hypothetical protein
MLGARQDNCLITVDATAYKALVSSNSFTLRKSPSCCRLTVLARSDVTSLKKPRASASYGTRVELGVIFKVVQNCNDILDGQVDQDTQFEFIHLTYIVSS